MKICLQDPYLRNYNLHEELLLASIGATYGAGVFAFVTAGGVGLLFKDECFVEFIRQSRFSLVVGTDSITNTRTIESLARYSQEYPNLSVRAFLNPDPKALFHPKYCWFRQGDVGAAIIGSGNLTQKGLRRNWEAFSVIDLNRDEVTRLESQWNQWFVSNVNYLRNIDDEAVLARVAVNIQRIPRPPEPEEPPEALPGVAIPEDEDLAPWMFDRDASVLLAEAPKASRRWNQMNFDKASFTDFFGATPGDNTLRLVFKGIAEDGSPQDEEIRQSVTVKSHNWRFEIDLAKGKLYPPARRPIGVFIKTSERNFLYMLKTPGDHSYDAIHTYLHNEGQGGVKRCRTVVRAILPVCSELPLWSYLVEDAVRA